MVWASALLPLSFCRFAMAQVTGASVTQGQITGDQMTAARITEAQIVEKLKLYAALTTLDVDFKQTKTLKDMNLQLKSEGHLTLRRPDRLIWKITRPQPLEILMSPNALTIRSGVGQDAQTQTLNTEALGSDQASRSMVGLLAWLNLDGHALAQDYEIYAVGQRLFRFLPKDKAMSPFASLEMKLSSDGQLERLALAEKSGDRLDIQFAKPKIGHR